MEDRDENLFPDRACSDLAFPLVVRNNTKHFHPADETVPFPPFSPEIRPFVIEVIGHEKISGVSSNAPWNLPGCRRAAGCRTRLTIHIFSASSLTLRQGDDENEMEGRSGRESEDKSEQVRGGGSG